MNCRVDVSESTDKHSSENNSNYSTVNSSSVQHFFTEGARNIASLATHSVADTEGLCLKGQSACSVFNSMHLVVLY